MKVPLAEAQKCPECHQVGAVANERAIQGGKLLNMQCDNERCEWYQTQWYVEVDGNGEVQVNEKAWEAAHSERAVYKKGDPEFDSMHEKIHRALGQQLAEETGGGQ